VGENVVVESEVIARDDIDTGILLDSPVGKTKSLCLSEELGLGKLSSPVCFGGFLQVTVDTLTRETKDRTIVNMNISIPKLKNILANKELLTIGPWLRVFFLVCVEVKI
jgi:hypothetical protein